jgi:hypothetical protein
VIHFSLKYICKGKGSEKDCAYYNNKKTMVYQIIQKQFLLLLAITTTLLLLLVSSSVSAFIPSVRQQYSRLTHSINNDIVGIVVDRSSGTKLSFGIPSFFTPNNNDDKTSTKNSIKSNSKNNKNQLLTKGSSTKKVKNNKVVVSDKKEISIKALLQLIAAGAGAPFLGDYEGIDKETGKFMFSLEANNLVDENGNSKQTQMPYFENGWIDESSTTENTFTWPWEKKKTTEETKTKNNNRK